MSYTCRSCGGITALTRARHGEGSGRHCFFGIALSAIACPLDSARMEICIYIHFQCAGRALATPTARVAGGCAQRLEIGEWMDGIDDFGNTNAEIFIDDHDFALGDKTAIDEYINRLAGKFVELNNASLAHL